MRTIKHMILKATYEHLSINVRVYIYIGNQHFIKNIKKYHERSYFYIYIYIYIFIRDYYDFLYLKV